MRSASRKAVASFADISWKECQLERHLQPMSNSANSCADVFATAGATHRLVDILARVHDRYGDAIGQRIERHVQRAGSRRWVSSMRARQIESIARHSYTLSLRVFNAGTNADAPAELPSLWLRLEHRLGRET